ncbi:hypothetical protein PRIPAC_93435 [Pristionchus pacificus]|uniref:Serpentine receptor class gamma n=1 Tax=Pristionchus pacificus TaxID=54126 RepID=A0A2A6BPA1_PRIPA|nr:hypothetical protein PRIPAC_93435 [Pristionchus pacificus]|eukprot:PDM67782.1 G protein-coupled receptor [Pristionchus pacificus]
MQVANAIQLTYGIIGIFLYILVIYAIRVTRGNLSKSFVVIYVFTAVINIATWLNSFVCLRLRSEEFLKDFYGSIENNELLRSTLLSLVMHFYYYQNVCSLLICFDRFAAIYSITNNTKLWWSKIYLFVLISSICACLGLNILLSNQYRQLTTYNDENSFWTKKPIAYDGRDLSYMTANANFSTRTQCGTAFRNINISRKFNSQLLFDLSADYITQNNERCEEHDFQETSFFLISFSIFITQAANLFVVITSTIVVSWFDANEANIRLNLQLRDVMYFTSDLFSLGPAVYTLLLPGPIRRFITSNLKLKIEVQFEQSSSTAPSEADRPQRRMT